MWKSPHTLPPVLISFLLVTRSLYATATWVLSGQRAQQVIHVYLSTGQWDIAAQTLADVAAWLGRAGDANRGLFYQSEALEL